VARLRSPRDDRVTETPPLSLTGSCSAHACGDGADPGVGGKKREEPRAQPPPTYRPTAVDRTRNLVRDGRRAARDRRCFRGVAAAVDRLGKMTAQPFSNSSTDLAGRHGVPSPLPSSLSVREREEGLGPPGRCVRCRFEPAKATGGCGAVESMVRGEQNVRETILGECGFGSVCL
jgi:hypothetical protein